jgi:hypothetical protein
MDDPGEVAVLALDKDASMEQHLDEETRLTIGEPERRNGLGSLRVGHFDGPVCGFRRERHISSSASRGCEVRPLPPRPPTRPRPAR